MKKFIVTTFVFGLLVIGAIAVIPLLIKVAGSSLLPETSPPAGAPFGFREFPIPERSLVAVKLVLPIQTLADRANLDFPSEISGVEKKDLHKKIKDGTIHWTMNPGNLTLRNSGSNLAFHFPLNGTAHATGTFGALNIPVKGNAQIKGSIAGSLTPVIGADWQFTPNLTTSLTIDQAIAQLGKTEPFDAREEVLATLGPKIKMEEAKIGPALTNMINLRSGIQTLWGKAHVTKLMLKEPGAWLVFDPVLAQMGPIDYSNPSAVSVTLGMVAQSFITNAETQDRTPEAVPCLEFVPEAPVTDIRIPIIANLAALNSSLADQTFLIKSEKGLALKVTEPKFELAGENGLNVNMNVTTHPEIWGKHFSGRIKVLANPVVDCQTQSFGFTQVKMSVETREALTGTAFWMFEDIIVKTIERELRINLSAHLPKVESEIQKVVNATKVPEGLELFFEKPKVSLLGVYTIEKNAWNEASSPGIVFVFGARGNISVKISKI